MLQHTFGLATALSVGVLFEAAQAELNCVVIGREAADDHAQVEISEVLMGAGGQDLQEVADHTCGGGKDRHKV